MGDDDDHHIEDAVTDHGRRLVTLEAGMVVVRAEIDGMREWRMRLDERLEGFADRQREILSAIETGREEARARETWVRGMVESTCREACGIARLVVERLVTPASAPIYAAALLLVLAAATATTVRWGDLAVGRTLNREAAADSAAVEPSGGGGEPSPEP